MKQLLILTYTLTFFVSGFAQYNDFPTRNYDMTQLSLEKLKFGIKISPSISWLAISHNDAVAGGASLKFNVGLTANYEMNEFLSVVSAVNYNSIGGYMADSRTFNDLNFKDYFTTNYKIIEVPLGLKVKTPTINKYNYYLQGGVTTGFVLSANEKIYASTNGKVLVNNDIMKDLTYPSLVGFFAGAGTSYSITEKLKVFGEVNYKNALTSIANGENYKLSHAYTEAISIIPAYMEFSIGLEF